MISYALYLLGNFIFIVIILDCLLSWIPNVNYYKQPALFIRSFSNFIMAPIRKIIPPIGGLDISPIIALLLIQIIINILVRLFASYGL